MDAEAEPSGEATCPSSLGYDAERGLSASAAPALSCLPRRHRPGLHERCRRSLSGFLIPQATSFFWTCPRSCRWASLIFTASPRRAGREQSPRLPAASPQPLPASRSLSGGGIGHPLPRAPPLPSLQLVLRDLPVLAILPHIWLLLVGDVPVTERAS